MILYVENSKDSQKLLRLTNEFSKGVGYKINEQKPVAFLYTDNEQSEKQFHLQKHQKNKILKN